MMNTLLRRAVIFYLCLGGFLLFGAWAYQDEFILDKIRPGASSRVDMLALLGEPKKSEELANIKVDHFEARDKLFSEVTFFFNSTDVLQWARLIPLREISADDAPLLFLLTSEPETESGNAFDGEQSVEGETRHFHDYGIHFYVHEGMMEEIWLTQPEADLGNIVAALNQPTSDLKQISDPQKIQNVEPSTLLMDDFNSENSGQGKLNYQGFENWEVASGGVDLIGNGFWDFHPDYGLHVDLDGSVNKAGTLQSKTKFKLLPGIYTLEFDLAGNFQRTINSVRVSMGDLYNEEFTLQATDPFRRIKKEIKVSSPIEARLVFQHEGGDNFGLLLDNVRLTKAGGDESIITGSAQSSYQDEGLTTYFGAVFDRHEGEGIKLLGVLDDTPAQNTGLQKGDIILEVENISFRDKGPQPEQFGGMIQDLPVDKPLRFHIERNGKGFDVWIKPLRINKEQLAAFQDEVREKFSNNYSRGVRLIAQDDYEGAIKYFKKSLKSRPMESHQGLGICYYHLGNYKEARKSIEKAIKLDKKQPLSWFYGAAAMDALDKRNGAMDGYKRYLKLNHDNAEMNAFARERLDALKKRKKSDLSNRLLKAIDAIKKEIEK